MSTNQKDRRENSFLAPCTKQLAVLQLLRVETAAANTAAACFSGADAGSCLNQSYDPKATVYVPSSSRLASSMIMPRLF